MPRHLSMLFVLSVILLMLSCSADPLDKLGSQGELCTSDNDCRLEFICHRSLCVDPEGVDPNPDTDPSPDSNPDLEPEPEPDFDPDPSPIVEPEAPPELIEALCKELCDHLFECGIETEGDDCTEQCIFDLQGLEESIECLIDLDCDEFNEQDANECFEDIGDNNEFDPELELCFETCDFLSNCDEFHERCGSDLVDQATELCFDACFDEDARPQIIAANGLPCEVIVSLAIDGFGLSDQCE